MIASFAFKYKDRQVKAGDRFEVETMDDALDCIVIGQARLAGKATKTAPAYKRRDMRAEDSK